MEGKIGGSGRDDHGGQVQRGAPSEHDAGTVAAVLGVIPDAVIVGDASSGRVVSWNPAAAAMFGYRVEEGPGMRISDLVAPRLRHDHEAGLARVISGDPTPLLDSSTAVELEARHRSGNRLTIELRLARLPELVGSNQVVAVVRDISARRRTGALVGEGLAESAGDIDESVIDLRPSEIDRTSAKAVVLVACNSAAQRRVLGRELLQAGYAVLEAVDGIDALNLVTEADLAVLDVDMPGFTGFEVMMQLQAGTEAESVPVILLSRRPLPSLPARAISLGAVDYLDLPAATGALAARVEAALRRSRLAVDLRRRNQELDYLSRTDSLTGVWNRRHAEEALELATSTSKRLEQPVSVLMVDVDHFKAVNDELGHRAGDRVLVHIARQLKEQLRAGDTLGRWGGEEFLIICPGTDLADAAGLGQRLRQAVAEVPLDADACPTISVGVAADVGSSSVALVEAADRALRAAKVGGRDRVETA